VDPLHRNIWIKILERVQEKYPRNRNYLDKRHMSFFEDESLCSKDAIKHFFDTSRSPNLWSLRALCNGIKAALIEGSLHALRERIKAPRVRVLDIGSGKGGDLVKWARHRPKDFIGIDVSQASVQEARDRHMHLIQSGRISTPATFYHADAAVDPIPLSDSSIEIVSLQFSLQFMFASVLAAQHVLAEAYRVLVPGGIMVGIMPDGDKLAQDFLREDISSVIFGHFLFRKYESTMDKLTSDPPVGIPYTFSLGNAEPCTEYVVLSAYFHYHLEACGFTPALKSGQFSENAQAYYVQDECVQAIVAALLKGKWCSSADWESLASFRVFLACKPACEGEDACTHKGNVKRKKGVSVAKRSATKKGKKGNASDVSEAKVVDDS
jgi:ubiquinone/menaquinone biosynthesis C-methylase UbiE